MKLAVVFAAAAATVLAVGPPDALDAYFSNLHDRALFDGAVVISNPAGALFAKGLGSANAEHHVPFTPDTAADGASLAKTFTAALLIALHHDRRLDLDKPAQLLLPELPYSGVTLRHLLSHTSGIPASNYGFFDAYIPHAEMRTTERLLRVLSERQPALKSAPGLSFEYSSFGYDLAALAASRAARKPYSELLQERFFDRFEMTSPFVRPGRLSEFPGIRTLAYRRTAGATEPNDVFDLEAFHGGSNIYVSARDLDRWSRAFLQHPSVPGGPETLEFATVDGARSGLTLGSWYRNPEGTAFWYSGHLQGFHSEVFRDLNTQQSIAYMSNNTIEPWLQKGIIRDIRAMLAGRRVAPPEPPAVDELSPAARAALAGTWKLPDQTLAIRSAGDGHLDVVRGGVRYPAYPEGRRFLYVPGLDYMLGLARAAGGRPEHLYLSTALVEQWATRAAPRDVSVRIDTPMAAPRWAVLERQLLSDNGPACSEFFRKYFDDRGYLQCVVRWGANDGPDDAFENFNRWPELHALGGSDDILRMYMKGHEGLLQQYAAAKTVDVPIARQGMYYKEFIVQSDWMHHGEGLQLFNRMGLSIPADETYQQRARRFARFYMGEDPDAPNYDPAHRIIRSLLNGSRGPMLRRATPIDWVGDPFDVSKFTALHGESTFAQFLAHYAEYTDVAGDHFLNLVATTLPLDAYLIDNEPSYKQWIVGYMDAWLERMKRNGGVIPSFVDLDGRIGGPEGKWWKNAYGWGFSPVNPVTGRREDRNRIPRALVGFNNALLVTGSQDYVDAWRAMIDAVNSHARDVAGRKQYPSMRGDDGWYGWRETPWNVGALEVWYWSQKLQDRERVGRNPWVEFLEGHNAGYPEQALQHDLDTIAQRVAAVRRDRSTPETRLADNMLDANPAATDAMVQLMWGALVPGREGGLLNARLRYFDPDRRRAGVPEDVAALVSELSDTRTVVTLANLNASQARTVIVQGGGYGEHQIVRATVGGNTTPVDASLLTVRIAPGCGATVVLEMRRYANAPTIRHPWERGTVQR